MSGKARVLNRVAVVKAARNLEGDNCSGEKGPETFIGEVSFSWENEHWRMILPK